LASLYTPLIQSWLRKYQIQPTDADDLAQEILLTVSRELPNFKHSGHPGAFRNWLRKILLYRVQSFWRSKKYQPLAKGGSSVLEDLEQLEDETSHASQLWNSEHDRHILAQLLEQIRPRFQASTWEAFHRQMFGGESANEVAASLGTPVHAAYVAKSRVLNALRQESAGLVDHL
jgi:RNA polymerase sigma-70 factor (ECF subfamily)